MLQKISRQTFSPHGEYQYAYWTDGSPQKQLMVLIPGFTGTHGDLIDFARHFKNDFYVIIPDLPGWGNSPKGKYHLTIKGYASFLHDLLSQLPTREKILLVGHCMGSVVAIEFAYKYPHMVDKVFLIGVPYLRGSLSDTLFQHLANVSMKMPQFLRPIFFFFRSRIFAVPLGFFVVQTKSLKKKLSIIFHNTIKQQFQDEEAVEKNWNSLVLYDYKKLRTLTMPIHLFHGEKDLLVPAEQAKSLLDFCPRATFEIIHYAGHMPPVEAPGTLANEIKKYLS